MSISPSRRSGRPGVVGSRARQIPAESHIGTPRDFLDRHESECRAARNNPIEWERLTGILLNRAADYRNIRIAIDELDKNGDTTGGTDEVRLGELSRTQRKLLCRTVGRAILDRGYRFQPRRPVDVPKDSGNGTRPIEIANVADRVVERALFQVLQPLLDPDLDPNCWGSRPGIGRDAALVTAQLTAEREHRYVWLLEDLENAFTMVIRTRLTQILGSLGLPREVVRLIEKILGDRRRGIPQGSSLSGLMLNVYLTFTLDRPWRRLHPRVPLLHVVDDILILFSAEDDAAALYRDLRRLVTSAGMKLKGATGAGICGLESNQTAGWLGFEIRREEGVFRCRIGEKARRKLLIHLEQCHAEPNPTHAARETIHSWLHQMGACYHPRDAERVFRLVRSMACRLELHEAVRREEFLRHWREAHARYRCLRRVLSLGCHGAPADSSARQHPDSAEIGRGAGGGVALPPFSVPAPTFWVWTDGSCLANPGVGGWAFRIEDRARQLVLQRTGGCQRATNNRMELLAVIRALEAIPNPSSVFLYTDSEYVRQGLEHRLVNWLTSPSDMLGRRNGGLWRQAATLCERHQVTCRWVRGHSGNFRNMVVDSLALGAALQQHRALFTNGSP